MQPGPGRSGGRAGRKRRLQLWNLNSTSNSPVARRRMSSQISANQREAETSANVNKHWKPHGKGNDVITNVISANQHFTSTFLKQIFKFQRRSCKLFFLLPPCQQNALESLLTAHHTTKGANIGTIELWMQVSLLVINTYYQYIHLIWR